MPSNNPGFASKNVQNCKYQQMFQYYIFISVFALKAH